MSNDLAAAVRQAREAAGLTVEQLSDRTKIRPIVLHDLEAGGTGRSGGAAYARGHLRAIAGVTGSDAAALLAAYDSAAPPTCSVAAPPAGGVPTPRDSATPVDVPASSSVWSSGSARVLGRARTAVGAVAPGSAPTSVAAPADDVPAPVSGAVPMGPVGSVGPGGSAASGGPVPVGVAASGATLPGSAAVLQSAPSRGSAAVLQSAPTPGSAAVLQSAPTRGGAAVPQSAAAVGGDARPDTAPASSGVSVLGRVPVLSSRATGEAVALGALAPTTRIGLPAVPRERRSPRWGAALLAAGSVLAALMVVGVLADDEDAGAGLAAPVAPAATTVLPAAPPPPPPPPAPPTAALRLQVAGDASWVDVLGDGGKIVFRGVLAPGTAREFSDPVRLSVTVGNAGAVQLGCGGPEVPAGPRGQVRRYTCAPEGLAPA